MEVRLVPLLICLAPFYSNGNPVSSLAPLRCEEIRIGLCKSLPYNRTRLPNNFEQETQSIVNRTLWDLAQRFNAGVCSEDLLFFVCSLYLPICVENNRIKKPIKPCRSVCEKVKSDCQAAVDSITGEESPLLAFPEFECDKLEAYDKGVCVTPNAFIRTAKSNATAAINTQRVIKKQDFLNANFDFAIKGKVLSMIMNQALAPNGYILQFNVSRVIIKHGLLFRGSLAQIWSETNFTCFNNGACTYLQIGKRYVILGHQNATKELTLDWALAWPRDKHLVDKLKTWKAESRKNIPTD